MIYITQFCNLNNHPLYLIFKWMQEILYSWFVLLQCAVLLEKYDKTNNYWEEGKLPTHGEYARLDDPIFRTCIECKKVFASSSSMRYHQRVVHSGEKPYKCNMCEKVFNRNDTLQTHIASHSDLKPFMCSVCGKQFGRRHVR